MNIKGRTLVEYLAVVLLVGILSYGALGMVNYGRSRDNNQVRLQHLAQIEDALEKFNLKYGAYPSANEAPYDALGNDIPGLEGSKNAMETLVNSGLLSKVPVDPVSNFGYLYLVADEDNFEGGRLNQYYTVIAKSEGLDVQPFFQVGNAVGQFEVNVEDWSAITTVGQLSRASLVDSQRSEGAMSISPDGGEGIFWH